MTFCSWAKEDIVLNLFNSIQRYKKNKRIELQWAKNHAYINEGSSGSHKAIEISA